MPELPEVETVANGVDARVRGDRITAVWTSGKPQTFKSPTHEIEATLTGARIAHVRRVGKTIVMTLEDLAIPEDLATPADPAPPDDLATPAPTQAEFLIHLGMTGRLLVADPAVPLPPHTHAVLTLSSAREIRFVDARRFGRLSIHRTPYAGPGAEPLTITPEAFRALFHGRRTPIKAALLNQSLLHGVGNIYADEALARAGIRPRRQAARLTRAQLELLRQALVDVLHRAIELGGSSVSDYVDAEGVAGFFQLEHRVYARAGLPCRLCGTPIRKITVAGRGTHFCPTCQR